MQSNLMSTRPVNLDYYVNLSFFLMRWTACSLLIIGCVERADMDGQELAGELHACYWIGFALGCIVTFKDKTRPIVENWCAFFLRDSERREPANRSEIAHTV